MPRVARGFDILRYGHHGALRVRRRRKAARPAARANRSHRPIREDICIVKKSLFDKIWESHVVEELEGGNALIFVDLVVAHEITSPQGIIVIERDFGDKLYDPN